LLFFPLTSGLPQLTHVLSLLLPRELKAVVEPPPGHPGRPAGLVSDSKKIFFYVKEEYCNLLNMFYIIKIVQALESFWLRH
jgi:hypothetical protein